ncbi:MAG: type III-B CRISPR-associated protein Cas10/Cmr2 [Bacteroidota bacterium]
MPHLFLFTLGPVQSFIAQARKTHDLYAGSRLLSHLCHTAGTTFEDEGGKVLFPNLAGASLPNRFMGKIDAPTEKLRAIGEAVARSAKDAFYQEAEEAMRTYKLGKPEALIGFTEQIQQHLKTYWAFSSIEETGYRDAYQQVEQTLGAVKNVRQIPQFTYQTAEGRTILGEQGRKCSIDGIRNVKFYRIGATEWNKHKLAIAKGTQIDHTKVPASEIISRIAHRKFYLKDPSHIKFISPERQKDKVSIGQLEPGEGISAVSFLKRHYQWQSETIDGGFPSTAKVALMDWLHQLQEGGIAQPEMKAYLKLWKQDNPETLDTQLFFEENLTQSYFEKHGHEDVLADLTEIKKAHRKLIGAARDHKLRQSSYYALLSFDGDSMGKWWGGAYIEKEKLEDFHDTLAGWFKDFSRWAEQFLGAPMGQSVYAGGDDFLGFVNLECLLSVLKQLRETFDEMVNQPLQEKYSPQDEKGTPIPLTFSAGVAVAHYKNPLNIVVQAAKNAEKDAKGLRDEKDAFTIHVLKRSGEHRASTLPWHPYQPDGEALLITKYYQGDAAQQVLAREGHPAYTTHYIEQIVYHLRHNFSRKWIHGLHDSFAPMMSEEGELRRNVRAGESALPTEEESIDALPNASKSMVIAEVRRLLKRAHMGGTADKRTNDIETLWQLLLPLLPDTRSLGNFFDTLFICDFIERHTNGHLS